MKKFYALALMAFMGVTAANAQALKLDKNYVIYTEHDGTTTSMAEALSEVFIDDDYNVFPVKGGTISTTTHKLTQDYTDPETGVSFKAGEYKFVSTGADISFSNDSDFPQGLTNVKKVVYYIGGVGTLKTIARLYQNDTDGTNFGISYEGEPETNRGWKNYNCPDLQFGPEPFGDQVDDTYLTYSSPIKLTVDFTNADGTDQELNGNGINVNCNGDIWFQGKAGGYWFYDYKADENPADRKMLFQFYEQGLNDAGEKYVGVKGENKIAWDAANRYWSQLKSYGSKNAPAYLMAVAFVCGDENAETVAISMKDGKIIEDGNDPGTGDESSEVQVNLAITGETVAAGTVLADNDYFKATTVYNATSNADGAYTYAHAGFTFPSWIQVRVGNAPSTDNPTGTEDANSTPVVIEAKKDTKLTAYARTGNTKEVKLYDQATGTAVASTIAYTDDNGSNYFWSWTYNIEAGKTYTLAINGGTARLSGFSYEGTATGIDSVVTETVVKNDIMYNIAGQRISAPVRGQIYIMNGKKYIAK